MRKATPKIPREPACGIPTERSSLSYAPHQEWRSLPTSHLDLLCRQKVRWQVGGLSKPRDPGPPPKKSTKATNKLEHPTLNPIHQFPWKRRTKLIASFMLDGLFCKGNKNRVSLVFLMFPLSAPLSFKRRFTFTLSRSSRKYDETFSKSAADDAEDVMASCATFVFLVLPHLFKPGLRNMLLQKRLELLVS